MIFDEKEIFTEMFFDSDTILILYKLIKVSMACTECKVYQNDKNRSS